MELITSYSSDSSETELSNKNEIEKLEADFFNLEESDDEVDTDKKIESGDLLCQASCLTEQPYGPLLLEKNSLKNETLPAVSISAQPTFTKRRNDTISNPPSKKIHVCDVHISDINAVQTSVIDLNTVPASVCRMSKCEKNTNFSIGKCGTDRNKSHIEDIFNNSSDTFYNSYIDNSHYKNFIPKRQWRLYQAHTSAVTALSWNLAKYGHLLLTGSVDSTLKIWSSLLSYNCVQEFTMDYSIKAAKWSLSGTEVICGGYDKKATIFDISAGKCLSEFSVKEFVSSIEIHPESQDIFLIGTKDNVIAFDKRIKEPIKCYYSKCQYVLDLAFVKTSKQFIASTEVVSHDCADRTLIVWDFATGAILSNQIFSECYTCPSIKVSPDEKQFVAQTNGNYIALFSTKRPYKLKQKRFMGHEVAGYGIECDFSPDSQLLVSGDAKGGMYFYNSFNCNLIKKIEAKANVPSVRINWHPSLNSTIATGFWDGTIQIWQ